VIGWRGLPEQAGRNSEKKDSEREPPA